MLQKKPIQGFSLVSIIYPKITVDNFVVHIPRNPFLSRRRIISGLQLGRNKEMGDSIASNASDMSENGYRLEK